MTTRREFLKNTAGTSVAAVASISAVQSLAAADAKAPQKAPAAQPANSYAQQLEAARAEAGVTGASFAYWDGKTLHSATAGLRNSVTGDPVTEDTLMLIGSVTKVLNTALMMQAVDEGKISLDDPVVKHVPELRLRDKEALARITCRMLVNHTNGIDGEWMPDYGPDQERIVDCINRCAELGQLYPPGEAVSYSNIGHVIAGYLSQKVFGESWYTLMKARIYEPLDMRHSLVDPLDTPRFRCSTGDITDHKTGKLVQSPKTFLQPSLSPAGSIQMMTATDLVTFGRALVNGGVGPNGKRFLSAASAARMAQRTASAVLISSPVDVGLGWWMMPGGVLEHGGAGRGVSAKLCAHPATGRVMALLMNSERAGRLMATFMTPLVQSWTGIEPPPSTRNYLSGPVDPSPYVGTYENNLSRFEVVAHEGGLAIRYSTKISGLQNADEARPLLRMYPRGQDLFDADPPTPGNPKLEMRFVQPRPDRRMRYLALFSRLYPRAA